MRLIRSVRRPFSTRLLHQYQQCQVNKTSSICLHPVLIEASNIANGTNILLYGRSYAASASTSADPIKARKPQRKVSKNERKSMVENYVKKYRETKGGKFPTASDARKDVGGSYYAVRLILQELIHNSKQPSVDTKETSLEKSAAKEDKISSATIVEVSVTRELGEVNRAVPKEDVGNFSTKVFESNQGQQSFISIETDKPKDVGTQSEHLIGKPESSQHCDTENNLKQEKLEHKLKFDRLESKAVPPESTETSRRESEEVPARDAEPQEKSSVWNNLKTLANGILNLWKKS